LNGKELPTELFEIKQVCHNMAKNLAQTRNENAVDKYKKEHEIKGCY
jgi:hypothetical protein